MSIITPRSLSEGVTPFYQEMRKVAECLEKIAQQHNITLAKCPPIDSNHHVEPQITLKSVLAVQPANALADMMQKAENGDKKCHW